MIERLRLMLSFSLCFAMSIFAAGSAASQTDIPDDVLDVFDEKCAFSGCHAGTTSPNGLDLTEDFAFSGLVNKRSGDYQNYMRVKPGDPARSYLIMKIKGTPGIKGERMPKGGGALSAAEVSAIESWIKGLAAGAGADAPEREYAEAFPGLSLATLPTTETLEAGMFSYRIAHRWRGAVDSGIDQFFGLDGGAVMFTQLAFPLSTNLTLNFGRSGENATYELAAKWRLMREKSDGSTPLSVALVGGLDWSSLKNLAVGDKNLGRTDGERFHYFGQLPVSRTIGDRLSVLVVPGILLNGNTQRTDEGALLTVGFAGKFELATDFSIFVEGVAIVSGADDAEVIGSLRREGDKVFFHDAFTVGLEKRAGGHVFHVYATNSAALSTNQYMSGSDFDFTKDMRLGFNIYRTLRMPF